MAGGHLLPLRRNPIEWFTSEASLRDRVDFGPDLWLSCNYSDNLPRFHRGIERNAAITEIDPDAAEREKGTSFTPKFNSSGLLTAVVTDKSDGAVLMVAFMNAEALAKTRETGFAHFYSRSRAGLWMKGETSGHVLAVEEILVDCDQDALVLRVTPAGPACHTGERTCFYRKLDGEVLARIAG